MELQQQYIEQAINLHNNNPVVDAHLDLAAELDVYKRQAQEERIRFFDEHGYTGLMPSAYRKLCDACITFYFRCTDNVEEAAAVSYTHLCYPFPISRRL